MDSKNNEAAGAITWLLCAGGAALVLSATLFWADDTVMGGAQARDKAFAEQMKELRVAQSSLPSRVTDERQKLPLIIEDNANPGIDSHDAGY